ncbi:hypothetical protein [Nitrosomonas sp. Nm58]|uniref:hypothetical protein n=1 Tax=Nitrosomonas sp. Nm58 TaxID=200126 RepID=UPI000896F325|nr:hypothetical protein [Nitrosomonas sp. Nm58]SDY39014.1 hypothetical protein SAMN05421754_100866 [Nitrosomonas sp. Nm58]
MNPQVIQSLTGNASGTGQMSLGDVQDLQKALEAGYGTDVAQLTGGGALRIQSLEKTMLSTIQENKHFALFNELQKTNATATVDEWTEQSGVGGRLGGSTNTETGNIRAAQGQYNRRTGMVKYLMTRREVSFVQTLQNAIADAEAVEAQNGALQLLTDAEYLCFEGDSTVVPTEYDGLRALLLDGVDAGQVSADNILDAEGQSLASIDLISKGAAQIAGYGNFGTPTHLFMSQLTQSDFDIGLDPAWRVPLNDVPGGGISLGSPVVGIRTSWGNIKTVNDVFIRDERQQMPHEASNAADASAMNAIKPASVAGVATSDASSKFGAAHDGNYYYFVTGVNAAGESTGKASAQVAVAVGDKVTLTITASVGGEETGYVIYRSRLNGTANANDVRQMARVAKSGATTTYVDLNREIPGSTNAYILNMAPGAMAITWRQLLPMLKFPLYPTVSAVVPWAQLLFGYLRIGKRRHHVLIKNIVSNGALWKPFA